VTTMNVIYYFVTFDFCLVLDVAGTRGDIL